MVGSHLIYSFSNQVQNVFIKNGTHVTEISLLGALICHCLEVLHLFFWKEEHIPYSMPTTDTTEMMVKCIHSMGGVGPRLTKRKVHRISLFWDWGLNPGNYIG
jgi:hypothetical protein